MRLILAAMMILGASAVHAEGLQLPDASVSAKTLGGTVLLIDMKHNLVIDGEEQAALNKELGEAKRKEFFTDMILTKQVAHLKKTYGSKDHKTTHAVIVKYEKLVTIPGKLSMK